MKELPIDNEESRAAAGSEALEEQFRALFDEVPLGVYLVDADFRVAAFNRLAKPVFARIPNVIGLDFAEAIRLLREDGNAEDVIRIFRRVYETGEPYTTLERPEPIRDTGITEYYEWQVKPFPFPGGRRGVICYFRDVTAAVRARRRIAESEERFRLFVTTSSDAIFRMSPDWREIRSLQGKNFLDDIDEPTGGWLERYVLPEDRPQIAAAVERAIRTKSVYEMENRVIQPSGEIGWTHSRALPILDEFGEVVEWFGAVRNVTVRRRAQEELKSSEAKYRTLFNSIDEGFCLLEILYDDAGKAYDVRYSETNRVFEQQTGVSGAEGRTLRELIPNIEDSWIEEYARVAETGEASRIENYVEGTDRWFSVYASRIGGAESRQIAVVFADITGRKRREVNTDFLVEAAEDFARLTTAEEIMETVGAKLGTFLKIQYCHFMQVDMAQDEIDFLDCWRAEGMPPLPGKVKLSEQVTEEFYSLMRAGKVVVSNDTQAETLTRSEATDALNVRAFVTVPFHQGGEWKYLFSVHDVNPREWREDEVELVRELATQLFPRLERARAAERETAAREDAERANRLKDEFLATVSHELRTPLNAIMGWATIIRQSDFNPAMMRRGFEVIERNARNQKQIISDILEVSSIITGKLKLEFAPVELAQIINNAIDTVRPSLNAKNIRLETELEDVPPISGDADRLRQIVWNLLSNAVKFTPEEGTITVRLARLDHRAQITVADSGSGIEPDFLPFVFDRFRQADGRLNRQHGGLGLGLAIVRHITEAHGGSVGVESEGAGCGATFTVELPFKPASSESAGETSAPAAGESAPAAGTETVVFEGALADLKILAVDDEADSLELVRFILSEQGAEVAVAASADEALALYEHEDFGVLITDLGMPGKDGYELFDEISRRAAAKNRKLPAVALTAYAREEDYRQTLNAGFQAYLAKPVEPDKLLETVGKLKSLPVE